MLRGTVVDNQDPMQRGRVRVSIWGLHGYPHKGYNHETSDENKEMLPWAEVVGSTAFPVHQGQGIMNIMPVGCTVWVDFEHGDLNCPIVMGVFVGHKAERMPEANPGNSDLGGGAGGEGSDVPYGEKTTINQNGTKIVLDGKNKKATISTGGNGVVLDEKNKKVSVTSGRTGVVLDDRRGEATLSNDRVSVRLRGRNVYISGHVRVNGIVFAKAFIQI